MNKVIDLTVDVLQRVGDTLGRHLTTEDKHDYVYIDRPGSGYMFPSARPAFHRPLDKKSHTNKIYSSKQRDLFYGGGAKKYSSDNLAASPQYSSFNNYRQTPTPNPYVDGVDRPPYGTGIGGPLNYGYGSAYSGGYSNPSLGMPYGAFQGNVGYAPEYYIAERRQVELVPAPPPRIIQQPVPVPFPVDRPVPQPYPVEVIRQVPIDRPVPVPVPSPVPFDRLVPVPVPVPVPSPPPPPVCVPYPVAVPCYVPVGIPVPSPPPSPVMFEQSVTHTQRWSASSPVMGMNPYLSYSNASFIR
jgi:hypothetical protein